MSTAHARAPARRAHVGRTTSRGHVQKSVNVNCRAEAAATHAASARARPAVIAKRGDPHLRHVPRRVTQRGGGLGGGRTWRGTRNTRVGTPRSRGRLSEWAGMWTARGQNCAGGRPLRAQHRTYVFLCATWAARITRALAAHTRAPTRRGYRSRSSWSRVLCSSASVCVRATHKHTKWGMGSALEVYNRFFFLRRMPWQRRAA
jgi:hypothetical protein